MAGRRLLWVAMLTVAGSLCWVGQAGAYIYWTNGTNPGIGRANLDGTNPNDRFISGDGGNQFGGLAVNGRHVYWSDENGIGRANVDGTNPIDGFIPFQETAHADGVAADSQHIYWAGDSGIGWATVGGTTLNDTFPPDCPPRCGGTNLPLISEVSGHPFGVAVDSQHVYWANGDGGIGRANLDGTNPTEFFVPAADAPDPTGVAVDSQHVYWANGDGGIGGIGRANLDGTNPTEFFIPTADAPEPFGVAVDGQHVYWADPIESGQYFGGIGRANLDGTNANPHFIPGADTPDPTGVAVDSAGPNGHGGKRAPGCVVPSLKGDTLSAAGLALGRARCKLGRVTRPRKHHGILHVASQSPKKGKRLKAGSTVAVTLK